MRSLPVLLLTCFALHAGPAAAAQRFAVPSGGSPSAATCPAAAPCTLVRAVNAGAAGDEIVVTPGAYTISSVLTLPQGGSIHGVAGQARPVITSTAPADVLVVSGTGVSSVSDLDLTGKGRVLYFNTGGGVVERVVLQATGPNSVAFNEYGVEGTTLVRDVIARADGTGAIAFRFTGHPSFARNVTAWATGPGSTGLDVFTSFTGTDGPGMCIGQGNGNVEVLSSFVHGEGQDLRIDKDGTCGPMPRLKIGSSSFGTELEDDATVDVSGGGNLDADPASAFVAPGTDFHQRDGAPTADAGLADVRTGAVDVDGLPRRQGVVDIGATELMRAVVLATPGTAGPTFNGTVDPGAVDASVAFAFGPTDAYGSLTAPVVVPAGAPQAVSAAPGGLDAAAAYHYRLVATQGNVNYTRTTTSGDALYTPPASPSPTPTASPVPTATPTPTPVPTVKKRVRCKVPKLKGLTRKQAGKRLRKGHCRLGKVRGKRGGKVVKQSRKAGRKLKRGTRIRISLR